MDRQKFCVALFTLNVWNPFECFKDTFTEALKEQNFYLLASLLFQKNQNELSKIIAYRFG